MQALQDKDAAVADAQGENWVSWSRAIDTNVFSVRCVFMPSRHDQQAAAYCRRAAEGARCDGGYAFDAQHELPIVIV